MDKDNYYLEQLKAGNQKVLEEIYLKYKTEFILYARKINDDEDILVDVYQDSIIALYDNVQSGKLTTLSSRLKTYLFSVGKFKLYRINKEQQKFTTEQSARNIEEGADSDLFFREFNDERLELISRAFDNLGKKCKQLLKLFYYRGFDLDEIKEEMDLANKNTVKSQKSRCISHLKQLIKK